MSLVYIPLNDYKNIGGPTTFIKNLAKYFTENEVDFTKEDHTTAQSILFPISYNTNILKNYKKLNKPIIQRLDGMIGLPWQSLGDFKDSFNKNKYDNSWIGPKKQIKYMLDAFQIKNIYKNYADLIIFQSKYCRDLCFDMISPLDSSKYQIIYNGVHSDIFYPGKQKDLKSQPVFVMTGRFRRNDMILPVLDALDILKSKYDFTLKLIGPIENSNLQRAVSERSYIKNMGPMTSTDISNELRNSDIYIFASLNAPCPNALLEAVATGLPVVSYDYGSVSELLNFNKDLIAETKKSINPLIKFGKHLSADALAEKLELALTNFKKHKEIAISNSNNYSFEKCGEQYLETIKKMITN